MDAKTELSDFLTTRRARLRPDDAGLPAYGANRRVAGLRREEVALLAGISVEYYTRLERGNTGAVSDGVLDGVARALRLDDAERDHLHRLVRATTSRRPPRRAPSRLRVRPTIQRMLDLMPTPAYLRNGRFDVLAANDLGRALYSPVYEQADRSGSPNTARFVFLDPAASEFFVHFEKVRSDAVAFLRAEAGRDPHDRELQDLVGELSTRSEPFRRLWAAHDVRHHRSGTKAFHHPVVGELTLDFEAFTLPGDEGQRLNVYTAEPASAAADALALLASWMTTSSSPGKAGAPTPSGDVATGGHPRG